MIRTFHSVGQGAFYSEVFEKKDFKFIYDCGSHNNQALIKQKIKASFDESSTIDAVFISHFHEDHINGLEFLLKNYRVRHLFLPELYPEEKIELFIHNLVEGSNNSFVRQLIADPERTISEIAQETMIHIVSISTYDEQISEESDKNTIEMSFNELRNDNKINSGTILKAPVSQWVFVPFNFRHRQRSQELITEFHRRNLNISSLKTFLNLWETKAIEIKDAYNSISGNPNTNSMVVYSGPSMLWPYNNLYPLYSINSRTRFYGELFPLGSKPGCIYFGDYEAKGIQKWDYFFKHFEDYWEMVGIVQIPHHGSKYNYNRKINGFRPMLSVISCGEKNRCRHPHFSTLRDILLDGGIPILVTERPGSELLCEIRGVR